MQITVCELLLWQKLVLGTVDSTGITPQSRGSPNLNLNLKHFLKWKYSSNICGVWEHSRYLDTGTHGVVGSNSTPGKDTYLC